MPESLNTTTHQPYAWTELFRCFQVALDPRKLLVAALGILGTALGWYVLSTMFFYEAPAADASARDKAQWLLLADLAGPGGKLRTLPWSEDRGPNPYVFISYLSSQPASAWTGTILTYVARQLPVMAEPLTKMLLPVIKMADEHATTVTRIYLILCLFWSVGVWAFAGGVITRIAAVQLSGKDRVSVGGAAAFVSKRYLDYILTPIVPIGIVGAITLGIMLLGMLALIPIVGDILYIVLIPLIILGGIIMTILVLGLVGYPLMYSTLSVEGSDTFDALSRAYNYVFQAPWTYAWNCIVAIVYGAIVTFFVVFVCSLMVYLGKWALTRTPFSEMTKQKADYLFIYSPTSFGWQELLLKGSEIEKTTQVSTVNGRTVVSVVDVNPEKSAAYIKSFQVWNWIGTAFTTFWIILVFLMMLGFSYSFFWSASTMIYLLMRQKVDDVELDEVYLEDDEPAAPLGGPLPTVTAPSSSIPGATSLPTVTPPVSPPPAIPVMPPTSAPASSTSIELPKLDPEPEKK